MIDLPRSTYYYQPRPATAVLGDAELAHLIEGIHDVFPGYGYRRITLELRARGHVVNHKRVARIMREHEVFGHHLRRFKPVAGTETDVAVFPNHYQNIIPTEPDRVWFADITYIRIASGFIYLAVVLDACSRKVIGYALSKRIDTPLALAALTAAYRIRKPAPGTCIHHTDRGCQYASALYRDSLEEFGLIGSMSAPANPYHNAQAESFMKTLRSTRFIWPDMRNSTTWQRDCHTSSKRFTTNGVCTRRWAINHLTSSKHNSLVSGLVSRPTLVQHEGRTPIVGHYSAQFNIHIR
jgi:putative transposase